jgi:hypothetical protein
VNGGTKWILLGLVMAAGVLPELRRGACLHCSAEIADFGLRNADWGTAKTEEKNFASPLPIGFPSPPQISFPTSDLRSARRGPPLRGREGEETSNTRHPTSNIEGKSGVFGQMDDGGNDGGGWGGPGRGRRRYGGWANTGGPIVQTEGGDLVNEDTVRTARETASHSTGTPEWTNAPGFEKDVFTFARIIYKFEGRGPTWLGWINDYPDSDLNLSWRLEELTSMKTDPDGRVLKLTSPDLQRYPMIYMVQGGRVTLRDEEVPILRNYLMSGGVLMADDFWGAYEWNSFEREMGRVLTNHAWVELPMSHPIFHCVFDLKGDKNSLQVPSIHFWERGGATYRGGESGKDMHVRAWLDDKGRIMVIATHNTDNGDGWEREGEDPEYFHEFSEGRAYPLAINIITYLMTH